jgi:hypothetical protein
MQQPESNQPKSSMPNYLPGHGPEEVSRLIRQANVLRPYTERLLRCAGIGPRQRILDSRKLSACSL